MRLHSPFLSPKFHIFVIVLCVAIIYWQVYDFSFLIGWDDQWFVTNYLTSGGFTFYNIKRIITEYYYGQYAPTNQLYYVLIYQFAKYQPGIYHLMNVVLHAVNGILVYKFIRILNKDLFKNLIDPSIIAFFTSVLFVVLPINVEPVAWVAASKVALYALFYLLALINYLKYINTHEVRYFYFVLLLYILSFGAKEQAVTLPVCMLLLDHLHGRSLKDKMVWMEKMPVFVLSLLFGFITIDSQQIDERDFYTPLQRIPLVTYTITEYFTKCVLPLNLSYLYPFPFQKNEPVPGWLWIHAFFVPASLFFLWGLLKTKWVLLGVGFFLIHMLIVSNLFSIARFSVVADRYAYIASIGTCLLIVCFFSYLKKNLPKLKVAQLVAVTYFVAICTYSTKYLSSWRDSESVKFEIKTIIRQRDDIKLKTSDHNHD